MKRSSALVAAVLAFSVSLAACSKSEESGTPTAAGGGTSGGGTYNCFTDAPADAPVTIAVYTSPTRAQTDKHPAETVRDQSKEFAGKVKCELKLVSPFEQADALAAGKAVLAAAKQGHGWAMYEYLTDRTGDLDGAAAIEGAAEQGARELGLDKARFDRDFRDDELAGLVKSNTQKTSQGHPLRRVQVNGAWAPCGSESLDCLGTYIQGLLEKSSG